LRVVFAPSFTWSSRDKFRKWPSQVVYASPFSSTICPARLQGLRGGRERAMLTAQNWIISAMGITVRKGLGERREREREGEGDGKYFRPSGLVADCKRSSDVTVGVWPIYYRSSRLWHLHLLDDQGPFFSLRASGGLWSSKQFGKLAVQLILRQTPALFNRGVCLWAHYEHPLIDTHPSPSPAAACTCCQEARVCLATFFRKIQ
jgi:hypothetical protein